MNRALDIVGGKLVTRLVELVQGALEPFCLEELVRLRDDVRFTVRGRTWTLDELETTYDERWEFGEVADVSVPGRGLAPGKHTVTAAVQLRISYLPWSPVTSCTTELAVD